MVCVFALKLITADEREPPLGDCCVKALKSCVLQVPTVQRLVVKLSLEGESSVLNTARAPKRNCEGLRRLGVHFHDFRAERFDA